MEKQESLVQDLTYTVTGGFNSAGIQLEVHLPQGYQYIFDNPIDISNNGINAVLIGMKTTGDNSTQLRWVPGNPLYRLNLLTSLQPFGDAAQFNQNAADALVIVYHDLTIPASVVRSFYEKATELHNNYVAPFNTYWDEDADKSKGIDIPKVAGMTIIRRRP